MKKNKIYLKIFFLFIIFSFLLNINFAKAECCLSWLSPDECSNPDSSGNCPLGTFADPLSTGLSCQQFHLIYPDMCENLFSTSAPSTTTSSTTTPSMINANYILLEGIPGFFNAGSSVDFPNYILAVYKFGLWAIGFCAMFMIMIGGYMYLTSAGNTSSAGKAKEVITDALIGLFLALVSYLLLYIINPDLVNITISF